MIAGSLEEFVWPFARLSDAVIELMRRSGLAKTLSDLAGRDFSVCSDAGELIEWVALRAGCEAEAMHSTVGALEEDLAAAFPAILQLEAGFVVILRISKGNADLLDPAGQRKKISLARLCSAVREPLEREQRTHVEEILTRARISGPRRIKAERALLNELSTAKRFDRCWVLRSMPGESLGRMLHETGAAQNGVLLVAAHTLEYLLWLGSWALLGKLSFEGRMDQGWLLAWVLLLASLIPCHLLTTWCQGLFAIGLGGSLKRRLLYGAMRLAPDEMRHYGIGGFLGQAIEAEAVESLALSGGIAGALAVVELAIASVILGKYALLLILFAALAATLGWRFFRKYERWTGNRMQLTQDLVESMAGQRTRLAQLAPEHWHDQEDQDLQTYLGLSQEVDRSGARLVALLPRAWLLAGVLAIAPSIAEGKTLITETAIVLGGVLLAYTAFRRLTGSFADVAAALIACRRIAPLYRAASRKEGPGDSLALMHRGESGQKLLEADRITFRYRPQGTPALKSVSLVVRNGEKILVEGSSGGGKTTFASLVSGIREPESGLLLLNGLDRHTTGDNRWRRQIASAPQFHENHILTETLAFNLLMGRRWPSTPSDMDEAETICRELGLGALIDAMPSGLLQMVGEGGWQLSHGEQSRIFMARALLQGGELTVLDESFAALDPENLQRAMECTLQRAKTLMVIAHP